MAPSYCVLTVPKLALGSWLDIGPSINRAINIFGDRTIISTDKIASHLFRYRLQDAAINQGARILVHGLSPKHSFEEISTMLGAPGINCLGIPFADDPITSSCSYLALHKLTPPTSIRIGLANVSHSVETAFKRYDDEDRVDYSFDPELGGRGAYFDFEIKPGFPAANTPFFLNANLEAVNLAARLAGLEHSAQKEEFERRPMIWTSPKEVEEAGRFFSGHSLDPENTIGIHLTASSGVPFEDMLSENNFFAATKHFIENGHNVLLIAGNVFGTPPDPEDENYDTHLRFFDRLQNEYASSRYRNSFQMFYGDVLTQAEIIRLCQAGFLSGETGPAHLASAVGTPKVTIASKQVQANMYMMQSPLEIGLVARRDPYKGLEYPTAYDVIEAMQRLWAQMKTQP